MVNFQCILLYRNNSIVVASLFFSYIEVYIARGVMHIGPVVQYCSQNSPLLRPVTHVGPMGHFIVFALTNSSACQMGEWWMPELNTFGL